MNISDALMQSAEFFSMDSDVIEYPHSHSDAIYALEKQYGISLFLYGDEDDYWESRAWFSLLIREAIK